MTCLEHASHLHQENATIQALRLNVVFYFYKRGQYPETEALYQQVLTSREKLLGAEHPDTLGTQHALANLYAEQGRYPEAEALYQQVLASREKVLGSEHPHIQSTRDSLNTLRRGMQDAHGHINKQRR